MSRESLVFVNISVRKARFPRTFSCVFRYSSVYADEYCLTFSRLIALARASFDTV